MSRPLIVIAGCADGTYLVEVGATADEDQLAGRQEGAAVERERPLGLAPSWAAGHVLDVDAVGLHRRPPPRPPPAPARLPRHRADLGRARRRPPPGRAVALRENPDHVLYGGRNRLYVSGDGGRFWRALAVELPEIHDVAWG